MQLRGYFRLLDEFYPGMSVNIARGEALGFPYLSKPFLKEVEGEAVSHVGFIEYPILLEGQWYKAGALHAVCTKITHRQKGYASALIQEALTWGELKGYEFIFLYTHIPQFYERLSFQFLPEYRFYPIDA